MNRKRGAALALALAFLAGGAAFAADTAPAAEMLQAFDAMHTALADDSSNGVRDAAARLAAAAKAAGAKAKSAPPFQAVAESAQAVAATEGLEAQREKFKPVSIAMARLVESGQLAGAGMFYCPMADAYWLQKAGDDALRNPYYGKSMLRCGEKVDKVEEG